MDPFFSKAEEKRGSEKEVPNGPGDTARDPKLGVQIV